MTETYYGLIHAVLADLVIQIPWDICIILILGWFIAPRNMHGILFYLIFEQLMVVCVARGLKKLGDTVISEGKKSPDRERERSRLERPDTDVNDVHNTARRDDEEERGEGRESENDSK